MGEQMHARILHSRTFKELIRKRSGWAAWLSLSVFVGYFGLLATIALQPQVLHRQVSEGSPVSFGWALGCLLIVGSWLLTGLYVYKANSEFDNLNSKLLREVA
ncbi:membrane protein [Cupriavidus sp. SK-4]|uniref:DUF485 domain-containing protein n=1 Tax=Cupriavidus sp. SK-4 TaxID=574750 RepID=UPI00044D3BD4|nr:DUF485 domain-containing protein [Cupriavidus sp. SK-4]EYS88294.1 membrane protein [Cupriavidus sp. SK-4]